MKTLKDLVDQHISQKAALAKDPEAMIRDADNARQRTKLRLKSDPSLSTFTHHYAEAMASVLPMLTPAVQRALLLEMLTMIIDEWEDINRQFENQLKPAAAPPAVD